MSSETSQHKPEEPAETTSPTSSRAKWAVISDFAGRLSEVLFATLVILMLTTPSWRGGLFTWLPFAHFPELGGAPVSAGLLSLLPFAYGATWAIHELATWRSEGPPVWTWGRPGVTAALLILTIFGVARLDPSLERIVFIQLGGLIIFWAMYLYLLNYRPNVVLPLSIVVLVQGTVALAQFLRQSNLNLTKLGELPLDPMLSGVSVIFAREQRWLRGYGLTAHPNLLGAMIAAILLLLLPALKRAHGRNRVLLTIVYSVGLAGLLVTFSRAATLAFISGLIAWLILDGKPKVRNWTPSMLKLAIRSPVFLLVVAITAVVVLLFGDLALSRIAALDSGVEAISINQRLSDWKTALNIIGEHPLWGVGLGQYLLAAQVANPFAVVVHSVPLLVTAELGIGGLLLFLWLVILGLRSRPDALAPWIALIIIGLFDVTLWLTGNWQTSVLFALIIANLSQDITT